ncbi:YlxR family protein [candidate division KSB1 bacterium]|nr:YlxR family protein [candidate division KSB1 bacterium]
MKKNTTPQNVSRPVRTCIGCLTKKNKSGLFRFVLLADGSVTLDREQKHPGRGAYVCPDLNCLEIAIKKNQFARVFRQKILNSSLKLLKTEFTECLKTKSEL